LVPAHAVARFASLSSSMSRTNRGCPRRSVGGHSAFRPSRCALARREYPRPGHPEDWCGGARGPHLRLEDPGSRRRRVGSARRHGRQHLVRPVQ
jgi:hypothetical protein